MPSTLPSLVRFASFEADLLRACELRREGSRVRLQEQPFLLLTVLLEFAGEVVTVKNFASASGRKIPSSISTIAWQWPSAS
jgi:hypothetical protein